MKINVGFDLKDSVKDNVRNVLDILEYLRKHNEK